MIVKKTFELLKGGYGDTGNLLIDDVRIGLFLTAVRLSDGSMGAASSLVDEHPFCTKNERDFGEFTPLNIKGKSIKELFESDKDSRLVSSLRTACVNAVSTRVLNSGRYQVIEDTDPIELVDLNGNRTITLVGAFQSYISKISGTGNKLNVLEFNENSLKPEHRKYFVPAAEYDKIIPLSDVVIITGQTLVNETIGGLLSVIKDDTQVIVTGPSGSMLPDILFGHGVSIIGAMKITRPGLVFDVVSQAGLGYHLFRYCAAKICILNEKRS